MEMQAPRGVRDILPAESWKWAYVLKILRETMNDFGHAEVHLPIFEHTELFARGVGDTTDIVEKEMYTFIDRGDRSITLRPEATASVVRACVEHNLHGSGAPVKVWTAGPMFRYERPQKGRYRQFWQIDAESIGVPGAHADADIIELSVEIFRRLGLQNLEVVLNSVGCEKCRPNYREKLKEYFETHKNHLCETCLKRLDRNPLRILDCKNETCSKIADDAPASIENLCEECGTHFKELREMLGESEIKYKLDKKLVRGLDYYTKTAYEILSGALGAQNAVCGGGRYDNLSETIGGPKLHGVGFAAGIERIVLVMEQQGCNFGAEPKPKVYVAAQSEGARIAARNVVTTLRRNRIAAVNDALNRGFKAQMKSANNLGADFVCIIGDNELANKTLEIKDLRTGDQETIKTEKLLDYIKIFV